MDFGASGAWMWNGGAWSQLTANNPENMVPFDIDGNGDKEIAVDLGSLGLWMWNGGVWSQLSVNNAEYLIAADTNDNGIEELIIDFGAAGLRWRQESGYMFGMTAVDPQNIIALDVDNDGAHEVVADFGTIGMWAGAGHWDLMTAADPNTIAPWMRWFGNEGVAAGLGPFGMAMGQRHVGPVERRLFGSPCFREDDVGRRRGDWGAILGPWAYGCGRAPSGPN